MRPWEASLGRGRESQGRGECWSGALWLGGTALWLRRVGPGSHNVRSSSPRSGGSLGPGQGVQAGLSEEALGRPGQEQGRGTKAGESLVLGSWPETQKGPHTVVEGAPVGPSGRAPARSSRTQVPVPETGRSALPAGPHRGSLGWGPEPGHPFRAAWSVATEISGEQPGTGYLRTRWRSLQRCLPGY